MVTPSIFKDVTLRISGSAGGKLTRLERFEQKNNLHRLCSIQLEVVRYGPLFYARNLSSSSLNVDSAYLQSNSHELLTVAYIFLDPKSSTGSSSRTLKIMILFNLKTRTASRSCRDPETCTSFLVARWHPRAWYRMLSAICVKTFITIGRETTDPWRIENLIIMTRRTRRTTFVVRSVAPGDPFPGLIKYFLLVCECNVRSRVQRCNISGRWGQLVSEVADTCSDADDRVAYGLLHYSFIAQ